MKKLLLIIAMIFSFAAFCVQAAEVEKISFKQTNGIAVSDARLLAYIQQRPGEQYDAKLVNEDIKRLFNTGDFSDVTVETTYLENGNVALLFNLAYQNRVGKITFENNKKFSSKELKKEVILQTDAPLNNSNLQKSLNNLREFYHKKGYNDAIISFKLVPTEEPSEVDVVFIIEEKLRLKVDDVTFEGNTVYSNFDLKYSINNRYSPFSWLLSVGLFDRDELELDKIRLREKYWDLGYLDFEIKDMKVTPDPEDAEFVDIHFVLEEGEAYKVKDITIAGNTVYPTEDLSGFIVVEKDAVFNYGKELQSIRNMVSLYDELGYNDVQCEVERFSDYESKTVDLKFNFVEGQKYSVRDILISGNNITKEKVIRRELAIQPGDPVDRNRVSASRDRLMGMGYFEKVETEIMSADELDQKDIHIQVEEKNMYNFSFGAGFSDVNSLMGMISLTNSNFDILDPLNWFSGGGQRFRIQGIYGIERAGFNVDFSEPWLFDIPLRWDVNGYLNDSEYDDWDEERLGVRTGLTKQIFDDFTTISAAYKFESVNIHNMNVHASKELKDSERRDLVSQFSVMLERDTRNSLMNPTSGYHVSLLGAISPEIFGSTESFYRAELKASGYYSILDDAITFMGGAKFGTVGGFADSGEAPLYERYFLGGGDSLRGFEYRSVSPRDSRGIPMGGQTMMLVTGEISHPIWNFIRGAVFADVGNVWADSWDFGDVNIGIGYGLRIIVPYLNAPIKLDLAYPVLNEQDGESGKLRFHFNMGFTF